MRKERKYINQILAESKIRNFIIYNLKQSLKSIDFSDNLISDLTVNLESIDVDKFITKHHDELMRVFDIEFFRDLVPRYFEKYVVPQIKSSEKIIDIGCGTGILASILVKSDKFDRIIGIDLRSYSEWNLFNNNKINFRIVPQNKFREFLRNNESSNLVLTWTLHHMPYDEQEKYLKIIYDNMEDCSLVILEDSYSEKLKPETGTEKWEGFMKLSKEERIKVMSVYDWIANRILARRDKVPIPFAYRTLEEWEVLFNSIGYGTVLKKFIGFPENRDINTPQSLMVFEKKLMC